MNESDENMRVANITPFGLRLQPALKKRVEEAAKANGRSLNSEIAARLEASFGDSGGKLKLVKQDAFNRLSERVEALEKYLAASGKK